MFINTEFVAKVNGVASLELSTDNCLIFRKTAKHDGFIATDWTGKTIWETNIANASIEKFSNELFALECEIDNIPFVSLRKLADGAEVLRLENNKPVQAFTSDSISRIVTEYGDEYRWRGDNENYLLATYVGSKIVHEKSQPVLAGSNITRDPFTRLQAFKDGKLVWESSVDKRLLPLLNKAKPDDVNCSFGKSGDPTLIEYTTRDFSHNAKGLFCVDGRGQIQWISDIPPILSYCRDGEMIAALTTPVSDGFYSGTVSLWVFDLKTGKDIAFKKDFKYRGDIISHKGLFYCIAGNMDEMEIIKISLAGR